MKHLCLVSVILFPLATGAGLAFTPGLLSTQGKADPASGAVQNHAGLKQVLTVAEGILSSATPEGEAGFKSAAALGVKTVVSVEVDLPAVEEAKKHGLKYVHFPSDYGEIPERRRLELARAVADHPGAVLFHCHSGRNRSVVAAAVAAITLGKLTKEDAAARLKTAGAAPVYKKLMASVEKASAVTKEKLAASPAEFRQAWKMEGLDDCMEQIDAAFTHLESLEKGGWKSAPDHPDAEPVADARRMSEFFNKVTEDKRVAKKPAELKQWLAESSKTAGDLRDKLSKKDPAAAELVAGMNTLRKACETCHDKYKD